MEHFGILGIIPPVLTIILAFATKDVIVSLFLGIVSGALIAAGGNPFMALMRFTDLIADSLADGWNIRIFLFCALLGGLVGMLTKTGAAGAFGRWASAKLKTRTSSQFMTAVFGIIIFIDDYFNSLSVGTVMRPICDKTRVSRAKLAYILDSTAAPICILAPISSWVVTVMSIIRDAQGFEKLGMSEFQFFIRAIPYNLYALLALLLVFAVIFLKRDFGPMKRSEELAARGTLYNEALYGPASGAEETAANKAAKPADMLFPIIVLIISAVVFFPVTTWLAVINGGDVSSLSDAARSMTLGEAFNNTDSSVALCYAVVFTITATYIYISCPQAPDAQRSGGSAARRHKLDGARAYYPCDGVGYRHDYQGGARRRRIGLGRVSVGTRARRRFSRVDTAGGYVYRLGGNLVCHRHQLGHVRHYAANCTADYHDARRSERHGAGYARARLNDCLRRRYRRRRVRRSCLAYFGYNDTFVNRRKLSAS